MSSFVIRWARRYARWLITLALLIVVLLLVIFFFKSSPSGIVLVNNSDVFRHEVISIPYDSDRVSLDELREQNVSLFDSCRKLVIYQVTHDGQLLVLASVGSHKSVSLHVTDGKPKVVGLASGDVYPERLDDVAWENDLIAFRAYGPALERQGSGFPGYDVLVKNVARPVVRQRYAMHLDSAVNARIALLRRGDAEQKALAQSLADSISYHVDHGNGLDCYAVGPTLGAGANALWRQGQLFWQGGCYRKCEILDNGPIRFTMRLTMPSVLLVDTIEGMPTECLVTEVRTISLDAASHLNRTEVRYEGLTFPVQVVAGPVSHHHGGGDYIADASAGILAYEDPTETHGKNGDIFTGVVFENKLDSALFMPLGQEFEELYGASGHVLGFVTLQPGETLTYYWGAAWSLHDIESLEQWNKYLSAFAAKIKINRKQDFYGYVVD